MLARRVLLVNHQPIFRSGLRLAVESAGNFVVVAEASSGYQAMQEAERTKPNILLVDVDLAGMSGYAIVASLIRAAAGRAAVLLSEEVDHSVYDRALASGAAGAVSSRLTADQLARVLRRVARSQPIFWEPEAPPVTPNRLARNGVAPSRLSLREIEVLDCVAQGFSNREIAEALFVNEQTIKNHMTSIFRKLEVEDRVQALLLSIKRGWVDFSHRSEHHFSTRATQAQKTGDGCSRRLRFDVPRTNRGLCVAEVYARGPTGGAIVGHIEPGNAVGEHRGDVVDEDRRVVRHRQQDGAAAAGGGTQVQRTVGHDPVRRSGRGRPRRSRRQHTAGSPGLRRIGYQV